MEEYLGKLEKAANKYSIQCDEYEKKNADLEQQEKAATVERKKLAQIVQDQNLSEVDIHRLTSDRQDLDAKLRTARLEKEEKSRRAYDLEIKRTQAYNTIEKLIDDYEAKATRLGLIPNPPGGYEHIDFRQELHGAASTAAGMVPDCTSQIKPALMRLRQDTVSARHDEEERVIGLEEELAELEERIAAKVAESQEAETRYMNQMTELNNDREVSRGETACNYRLMGIAVAWHLCADRTSRNRPSIEAMSGHQEPERWWTTCCGTAVAGLAECLRQVCFGCRKAAQRQSGRLRSAA